MALRTNLLRQPLNAVLANEGHVRVLRELIGHGGELSPPDLATRTGLTRMGVWHALTRLAAVGVIESVGLGRYPLYRVRRNNPLVPALKVLYEAESARYARLLEAIRAAAYEIDPPACAVWLYGSAARREDRPGSDVDVAAVFADEPVEPAVAALREKLADLAEDMGIALSIVGLSNQDVLRLAAGDAWWESVRADAITLVGETPGACAARLRRIAEEGAT